MCALSNFWCIGFCKNVTFIIRLPMVNNCKFIRLILTKFSNLVNLRENAAVYNYNCKAARIL